MQGSALPLTAQVIQYSVFCIFPDMSKPASPSDNQIIEYSNFASAVTGEGDWMLAGFPLPDGGFWQYREPDAVVIVQDGFLRVAAVANKAEYEKDVKGFVDLAFADMPRIPIYQPYVNVAMQKNVSGYQYWFHRRLDYRGLVKA